ncbi:SRPBCC family protein [Nonomuraea diastatica]|uniref:Carbon monoxide dehydrogenase n=1 Tax=Nonomuraea diastatica TaxID=1848329 RepID=A0A4R4WWP0_9ACTN|nr:carbon monoxide dehydrogenase subunit G [Nonomuraea diastatica]TDD22115.1 carbon monoxide dehydrogenase [Nonomuraea diastatica]
MKVGGSAVIGVQRDQVWTALQDPAVLVRTIPGCERLEESGHDTYRMTVNAGVASIKGVYQGEVALTDPLVPESFTLRARGQGAPGTVDATVVVRLTEIDGGTRVDYDADAVIGGMIGGVGQRMLGSVARRTAGEFFSAVEEHLLAPAETAAATSGTSGTATPVPGDLALSGPAPGGPGGGVATPGAAAAGTATVGGVRPAGAVYQRPAKARAETRPWVMLAAFGMGAGVAVGGVVVGWLLGRGYRRDS